MAKYSFFVTETIEKVVWFEAGSFEEAESLMNGEPDLESLPDVEIVERNFTEWRDELELEAE